MSALLVTAAYHSSPDQPLGVGRIVVDTDASSHGPLVNLDLGQALGPANRHGDEDAAWVSLYPDEARALAAALLHFAREAGR